MPGRALVSSRSKLTLAPPAGRSRTSTRSTAIPYGPSSWSGSSSFDENTQLMTPTPSTTSSTSASAAAIARRRQRRRSAAATAQP